MSLASVVKLCSSDVFAEYVLLPLHLSPTGTILMRIAVTGLWQSTVTGSGARQGEEARGVESSGEE